MAANPLLDRLGEDFFAQLPGTPGVYFMLGTHGRLLYVGKAVNLRARLRSYTRLKREVTVRRKGECHDNERLLELVEHIQSIRWEDHPTESAALLRESELIRGLRPPYNVAGAGEELYLYIGIRRVKSRERKIRLLPAEGASPLTALDTPVIPPTAPSPSTSPAPALPHPHFDFRINNWPDFTDEPDGQGYQVYGAYRHRGRVKRGFGALLRLLYAYQFASARFTYYPGAISREKPPWRYRAKLPEALEPALRDFLNGKSQRLIRLLFAGLLENEQLPAFMRHSIQDDIDALVELYTAGPGLTRGLKLRHAPGSRLVQPDQMKDWVERDALASYILGVPDIGGPGTKTGD